jgi:putative copper export protein
VNCPSCSALLTVTYKRVKRPLSIGSTTSVLEGAAVLIAVAPLMYDSLRPYSVITLIIAFLLALVGHGARYGNICVAQCEQCKKEFPVNSLV